ncbi:glycosyltransferase family 4 protein [Dechloromonas denitrificans]|uniref:glycosyltransferase family 4 protein n=1 Tax=Dechloromonas denitrificans TaxID=281362 RepID=UPI001CF889FA|nr:glycosyltransferase family 4 protein [Dechloromonas denitrificans]UCV12119.1 glycosyltransferase family 4 protein [Dechloromonas denitrificans]
MSYKIRILIVHNSYQSHGGEDSVVDSEIKLLQSHGHEVVTYFRSNNEILNADKFSVARQTLWSVKTVDDISKLIISVRPDVVHVHNTFPLISPSLYWAIDSLKIPVVQTLHNFRLSCLSALYLRDSAVCEDCVGTLPWRGVLRKCYRNSTAASVVLTGMLALHRKIGTFQNKVTKYIALNDFCRNKFIEGGLPGNKITVKPNFIDEPTLSNCSRSGFLFVGRLSLEKGISVLAKALTSFRLPLIRIAGDGPLRSELDGVSGVTLLGLLDSGRVHAEMNAAMALIVPSIWYENFPRTIVEAYACGLPVIASRIGALEELVIDGVTGLLFEPNNPSDLAEKMRWASEHPEEMARMGLEARQVYLRDLTAEKNYSKLIDIYNSAIGDMGA